MESTIATNQCTIAEYFAVEEKSDNKYEFVNERLIPMSGASFNHNVIATNLLVALKNALSHQEKRYYVLGSDMKVYIDAYERIRYPDTLVICEHPSFYGMRRDTITNPLVIVEILSDSTASSDRGKKFEEYQTLQSLQEYVLVRQDQPDILTFFREEPNLWRTQQIQDIQKSIVLTSVEVSLSLEAVYDGIGLN